MQASLNEYTQGKRRRGSLRQSDDTRCIVLSDFALGMLFRLLSHYVPLKRDD